MYPREFGLDFRLKTRSILRAVVGKGQHRDGAAMMVIADGRAGTSHLADNRSWREARSKKPQLSALSLAIGAPR